MDHAEEHELKDAIKRKYPVHKNCVSKADLRKLVEKWRKEHKDEYYYHAGLFADELEELLGVSDVLC